MHSHVRRVLLVTAVLAVALPGALLGPTARAAAPFAKVAGPGHYRIMLGDFEVTALSDGTVDLPVGQLLQDDPAKVERALSANFLKTPLETSVNAYLVNTGTKLILIDTGAGSLFGPTLGKLAGNLKAAGYAPGQVDEIYITHMHPDHVGGLAKDGVRVFANAVVRADVRDADYWLSDENLRTAPESAKGFFQGAMASLRPYVKAGKFRPFSGDGELTPGVRSFSSYGHTAGHTSYVVESKGDRLMLLGDLIHVAAVQFDDPSVTIAFDTDPRAAAESRDRVFKQVAGEGTLIGASHIQFPGLGHLRAQAKGYQWVPVNYTQPR